jgi:hypothetical protein
MSEALRTFFVLICSCSMDEIHSFKRIGEPTFGGKGCDDCVP